MGAKIADFGLSRLFEDNKTHTCTTSLLGSFGYMAPEYLIGGTVSAKADIYNLGVIITEIITGTKVNIFSFSPPTSYQKFVDGVINNWRNRLGGAPSETACKQIKHCLEIGLGCIKINREERPTSREIIERLERWETTNCNVDSEKRPAADQILTHMEEKPSASTTAGYELCAVPEAAGLNLKARASPNRSRPRGIFHRQLSRVMRFITHQLSCVLVTRQPRPSWPSPGALEVERVNSSHSSHSSMEMPAVYVFQSGRERMDHTEFTFAQMEAATMGFSLEAKIGEGSFGTVYRGYLPDGREVAIKRGVSGPRDERQFQESEFLSELAFLSRLRHKYLVGLVGYCAEKNMERLLVYEYMKNGDLYDHLHPKAEPSKSSLVMSSWKLRIRILLHASRGIEYLHSYAVPRIIHRDIKSSNILLDASWRACLSGFGLSLRALQARHWVHRPPVKSDVYGFGVVMLEVLTGKPAILEDADDGASLMSVVDYAVPSIISGELGKVLDPRMPEPAAHEAEALGLVAYIAVHCVQLQGKDRPAMTGIVANLETAFDLCEGSFDGHLVRSVSSDSDQD